MAIPFRRKFFQETTMRILYDSKQLQYKTPFGTLTPGEKCTMTMYVPSTVGATMVSCIINRENGQHQRNADLPFKETQGPYDVFQGSFELYDVSNDSFIELNTAVDNKISLSAFTSSFTRFTKLVTASLR